MNKELLLPDTLTTQIEKRLAELENTLNNLKEALIQQLQKEITTLQSYLTQSQNGYAISKLYEKLCPARQALITPVTLTHE